MSPPAPGRFRRKIRILFRRFRFALWGALLVFLSVLLYLDHFGLPGFLKRPLQNRLRAQGLDLEFSRVRWRVGRGIIAENVQVGRTNTASDLRLALKQVQIELDYWALLRFQFHVRSLHLQQGQLAWSAPGTNGEPRELSVNDIQTDLRLLPGDVWQLEGFEARLAGARIQLTGMITNASAIRDWTFLHRRTAAPAGAWETRLRELADTLRQIRFSTPPLLHADVQGDARDLKSFSARLSLSTPDADTPWGAIQDGGLRVQLRPATPNAPAQAQIKLVAASAQTRWATGNRFTLHLDLLSHFADTNSVQAHFDLAAADLKTQWGNASTGFLSARWIHPFTNAMPRTGSGEVQLESVDSRWGRMAQAQLSVRLFSPVKAPPDTDESWAWWRRLASMPLDWDCQARGVQSPRLEADRISCAGEWRAPWFDLKQLSAGLYGGKLEAQAECDVSTRQFRFNCTSDFDAQKVAPLLTEKARHWMEQYSWTKPPAISAEGTLTLPPWTNLAYANWSTDVRPSIRLKGNVQGENGAFRGVGFSYALTHFTYSNFWWRVPDLVATRPDGRLDLAYEGNDFTHDYYFKFRSTLDPHAFRPLLETNQQRAFDFAAFTQPPVIEGEVWGRWHEPETIGGRGRIAATNFTWRGESASDLRTTFEYTNLVLKLIEPRLHRGTQEVAAASLVADFTARKMYVTNGVSTADPSAVARAIGPKIGKYFEPYHFLQPPTAHVEGAIPLHREDDADLHFVVAGGPFEWLRFRVPSISGKVDWVGQDLSLKDLQAAFYKGTAVGHADFDFRPDHGADFRFNIVATDADLHTLMEDLTHRTNHVEGLLTARVSVTEANSADWQSWQGKGRMNLRDGVIWDIPIFGILSPALDAMSPGLGSSRAREASATFVITNGVVHSDDLEIRASVLRLQYWGNVDLQGGVSARVQAELLRDTWVVGRLLSWVLWPVTKVFEYKVSGTIHEPRTEPVFIIPRIMLMPFHPIRTIKEMIPEEPNLIRTNGLPFVP